MYAVVFSALDQAVRCGRARRSSTRWRGSASRRSATSPSTRARTAGRIEVRKRPIVGTSQSSADRPRARCCTRRLARDARTIFAETASCGAGSSIGSACGGGHQASLRKRRMLSASTGMTSRNRNTAIAEPTPKSLTPPKAVTPHRERDHVRVRLRRLGREREHDVEHLEDVDDHRDEDDAQHRREQRHGDAAEDLPLGRAVGARRLEHVAGHRRRAPRRSRPSRSRPRSRCRRSGATGVIRFGPSHAKPPNGFANVCAPIAGVVRARPGPWRSRTSRRRFDRRRLDGLAGGVPKLDRHARAGRARPSRPRRACRRRA